METKYATPLSQLYHPLHLFHPPDLSSSQVFSLLPYILPSSIILIIIVCYLRIITMKKLINLDHLACCCHCACFFSVNSLSAQAEPTFDSICTVCKSFSRMSWPTKDKNDEEADESKLSGLLSLSCMLWFYWQAEHSSWADFWFNLYDL